MPAHLLGLEMLADYTYRYLTSCGVYPLDKIEWLHAVGHLVALRRGLLQHLGWRYLRHEERGVRLVRALPSCKRHDARKRLEWRDLLTRECGRSCIQQSCLLQVARQGLVARLPDFIVLKRHLK